MACEFIIVDARWLSPDIHQQIVLIRDTIWIIWLDTRNNVIKADEGAQT